VSVRIATRKSKLAQVQADIIIKMLCDKHKISCEKLLLDTMGDMILDVSLDKIGGKGLFVKNIELAILEGNADAAVHSMKDVPYDIPEGFEIAAIPKREDARDVLVSKDNVRFVDLPPRARIGTSSIRRASEIKLIREDIEIVPIRGNVQTRIDKIDRENLDGIILAAAGLNRLHMENMITEYFDPDEFVPAIGQGALGVEALSGSTYLELFKGLDDIETRMCVEAERSFMKKMNGDCHSPIGAYARIHREDMYIVGVYGIENRIIKKDILGSKYDNKMLGTLLGEKIIKA